MEYIANPVKVDAYEILSVDGPHPLHGGLLLRTMHGQVLADSGMLARYTPVAGDYVVRQDDGYTYLNPKDVFERKYSAARPLSQQLDESLSYHWPDAEQLARIEKLRAAQKAYAAVLEELCPPSRALSIAKTEFETHAMWAVKSIVLDLPKA